MKLLSTQQFANGNHLFFLPKGLYGGLVLHYYGTNGATPKTKADLGTIRLVYNGNTIIDTTIEMLTFLNDLKGGHPSFASVPNGGLHVFCYVPFSTFDDKNNSYVIEEVDNVYVRLNFDSLSDINGRVDIFGIERLGVHNYFYNMISKSVVASGAGTITETLYIPNIKELLIKNNANLTNAVIEKDKKVLIDGYKDALLYITRFENKLETSFADALLIDFKKGAILKEVMNNSLTYKYTFVGSTTLEQTITYVTRGMTEKSIAVIQRDFTPKYNEIAQKAVESTL